MKRNRLPTIVAWAAGIFLLCCGLIAQVWGASETMLVDYRLFLQADSVWVIRADNGVRVDSAKKSTITTIDTTFTISDDTRTDIYFFAFGSGYATNGSPTLYVYDNHNTGDTSGGTLPTASAIADAVWDEDSTGHYTSPHMAYLASQTGAGASITDADMAAIADSVWNELQSGHTIANTFGAYLDDTVSNFGMSGNGAYTYDITLLDTGASVDSVLGSGTIIYVNNKAQDMSGGPYWNTTLNTGVASFNLDAGDWVMFTTEPGFAQKVDTFTVSAAASDTLMLYSDAGNRTTVAWYLQKADGTAYSYAVINFNLKAVHPYDSMLVVSDSTVLNMLNYEIIDTANIDGLLSTPLWANSLLTGDSSYYQITARDRNGRFIQRSNDWKYNVPDADTTVWIHNLTRW